MNWLKNVMSYVQTVWKAVGAGVVAAVGYVMASGIFALDQTPLEALFGAWRELGAWSVGQWFGLLAAVLAAYGVVWAVPNKPSA